MHQRAAPARLQRIHVVDPPLHLSRGAAPPELGAVAHARAARVVDDPVRRHPLVEPSVEADVVYIVLGRAALATLASTGRGAALYDVAGVRLARPQARRARTYLEHLMRPAALLRHARWGEPAKEEGRARSGRGSRCLFHERMVVESASHARAAETAPRFSRD